MTNDILSQRGARLEFYLREAIIQLDEHEKCVVYFIEPYQSWAVFTMNQKCELNVPEKMQYTHVGEVCHVPARQAEHHACRLTMLWRFMAEKSKCLQ